MLLHTDIPTRDQLHRLLVSRNPASVSIYLATDPVTADVAERTELGNLATQAIDELYAAGVSKREVWAVEEGFNDLLGDEQFWRHQARSLAVFATPETLTTFRLPNHLTTTMVVADRFQVKPLLRAVTFPQVALVLALAQGSVRVIEVSAEDEPSEVRVADMPSDADSASGPASDPDRTSIRRIQGARTGVTGHSEGRTPRLRAYARQIDRALRPVLGRSNVPLILAAAEPMESVYRSVNSYPHLAAATIAGNPEQTADAELAGRVRELLDAMHASELGDVRELYEARLAHGRALQDLGDVARAATFGAVETVLVDIDETVSGTIDEETGAVTLGNGHDAGSYGVVDEIARRTLLSGGRVLAVRREDIPDRGSVAAILRYAI